MQKILITVGGFIALILSALGFQAVNEEYLPADLNQDGAVTLQDVSIVMSAMSTTSSTSTSNVE